jgi:hypothetical protein
MNRAELAIALDHARINPRRYSLEGGLPNDAYCLDFDHVHWLAYYSERGRRFSERSFTTEDAACRYLLEVLIDEPSVKLRTSDGGER